MTCSAHSIIIPLYTTLLGDVILADLGKWNEAMSNSIYAKIKDQIMNLEYPPGTMLNENDMTEKFSVSRTPVRDAFKALQNEGLLEIKPHIGTFVTKINLNDIADALYMRTVVEQAVFSDLAFSYDPIQAVKARVILQKQKELIQSEMTPESLSHAFIRLDDEFHYCLYVAAGREQLSHMVSMHIAHYHRFRALLDLEEGRDINIRYQQHVSILDFILSKKVEELRALLYEHINQGFAKGAEVIYQHHDYFSGSV